MPSRRGRFVRFLSVLLVSLGLIVGVPPVASSAAAGITVHLSFEGFNLGQGYYIEPVAIRVPAGSTAAEASLVVLDDAGHAVDASGAADSAGFYLQGIAGFDTGEVAVPSYLTRQSGFSLGEPNGDEFLGVGDYNSMSGWMLTVNNVGAAASAGATALSDGDVVRWQFTLYGYGCDLGVPSTCWGGDPYFTMADRTELIRALTTAEDATATAAERSAALAVGIDPLATDRQVREAAVALTTVSNYALTAPADATVTILHQPANYGSSAVARAATIDNGDGTATHLYQVPATDGSYAYRVSASGELTQAGFISSLSPVTVTFPADGDPRSTQSSGFAQAAYDDAGVLLNVGATGELRLGVGEEFVLRAFRAPWQIVNSVTANKMIEPDFRFTVLSGKDVVRLNLDETLPGRATLTALASGTAVVEVGFDAITVGSAHYGATAADRTAVFVVEVSSHGAGDLAIAVPKPAGGAWDSEFDTWYLTGSKATATVEVSGSPDRVTAWNPAVDGTQTLSATDGSYRVTLQPGTTIVKAEKGEAVTYRTIRAARVTPQITNVTDPGDDPEPGDQVKIHLDGALLPVPKLAALYNPYFTGAKAIYTDGTTTYTGISGQYTFSSANTLTVRIPATATDGFTLTGGRIAETHFGSPAGAHRTIPAAGLQANMNAIQVDGTYSVLPDLTLIAAPAAPLDLAALQQALAEAADLVADDYTTASWDALQHAVAAGKALQDDAVADQHAVDEAVADLAAALAALSRKGEAPPVGAVAPETVDARRAAAGWLAGELDRGGEVLAHAGRTDWGLTADAVFALAGSGVAGEQLQQTAEKLFTAGEEYIGSADQVASRWPYLAKTVLALQVAGLDASRYPTGAGSRDLVAELRQSVGPDGRFVTAADAFKTSLGILALARSEQGVPVRAVAAFAAMACAEDGHPNLGSFGYVAGCGSADIDTTALAVQALLASGATAHDPAVARAVAWLGRQQAEDGSFPSPWGPGNTNSGGLAGQALAAAGDQASAADSAAFLVSLQLGCTSAAAVDDPVVAATLTEGVGAIAYNRDGWDEALQYGLDEANLDQWRRATAQAILGLGAPSLGFLSAADLDPETPQVDCGPTETVPASAVKAQVTAPIPGDTLTPGTVVSAGSLAAGYRASYRWLRDGTPIPGATARTYKLVTADQGHRLASEVTVAKDGLLDLVVTSAAVSVPTRTISFTVKYSGSVKVGKTLKSAGAPKRVKYSYQWLRDGKKVVGKKSTYKVSAGDAGHTLQLRVTATKSGATKTIRTTVAKAVPKVTPKVTAKLSRSTVKPSARATVKVTVSAKGFRPSGTVTVSYGAGSMKATVQSGKATVKLPKLRKGTYEVKATYSGAGGLKGASVRIVALKVK